MGTEKEFIEYTIQALSKALEILEDYDTDFFKDMTKHDAKRLRRKLYKALSRALLIRHKFGRKKQNE